MQIGLVSLNCTSMEGLLVVLKSLCSWLIRKNFCLWCLTTVSRLMLLKELRSRSKSQLLSSSLRVIHSSLLTVTKSQPLKFFKNKRSDSVSSMLWTILMSVKYWRNTHASLPILKYLLMASLSEDLISCKKEQLTVVLLIVSPVQKSCCQWKIKFFNW